MLVYGDQERRSNPLEQIDAINRRLDHSACLRAGLERHSLLIGALIEAGQLQQGVADAVFGKEQRDRASAPVDEIGRFLHELSAAVCRSWDSGFVETGDIPRLSFPQGLPDEVTVRIAEGFGFYALYPEAYIDAARSLPLDAPPLVIGIRSIGTALGSVVAAALGAPAPVTVRPFGDSADREIALDHDLQARLLAGDRHYVIVDEGPGQSGSSFASVSDWLRVRGVSPRRIALLPSHGGSPGAAATEQRREWWRSANRRIGDFEERWAEQLRAWTEATVGALDGPLKDISGGCWRALRYERESDWPAVVPAWEKRKFLGSAGGEPILIKFAGVGAIGEEKLRIARALHSEGLTAEPQALAHGFIVERWISDAAPLGACNPAAELGRYAGLRARMLPAVSGSGASVAELLRMAKRNLALELGDSCVDALARWDDREEALERRVARVRTDNRMQPHEWLRGDDGRLIKTDALDHHQAHDLIGCQDMAWDIAGAIAEFELQDDEAERMISAAEEGSGRTIDRELFDFCRVAYLAVRIGQVRLGAMMTRDLGEQRRIRAEGDRYAGLASLLLQHESTATRLQSSVG